MKTVALVCQNVDLGYHVEGAYANSGAAQAECDRLNVAWRAQLIQDLIRNCNYTEQQAREYTRVDQYFVIKDVALINTVNGE